MSDNGHIDTPTADRDEPDDVFNDDGFHEECGLFGIHGTDEASVLTALGLHALQHRGQEASGIVAFDGKRFNAHRALGQVGENFGAHSPHMDKLRGRVAIGHNRYSTSGNVDPMREIQPFSSDLAFGPFSLAHNGNITNTSRLRASLVETGSLFQSSSDTEVIVHLVARSRKSDVVDRLTDALRQVEGAYSIVCIASNLLIGVRDPHGVRPLVIGKRGKSHVLASETCALDIVDAELVREVEPGEMVVIGGDGESIQSLKPFHAARSRFCVFEYVYFARPDSIVDDVGVYHARKDIGRQLAREAPADADIVVPVPDSGGPGAIGYAEQSGLPYELGIIRSHYVGRTFIQPSPEGRAELVKLKHNANPATVRGKRVVLVDDSIVRGTTAKRIVGMLRQAGALEVHLRIASPPTIRPCYYGVDTPNQKQLVAANMSVAEMAALVGADSLAFISIDGLYLAIRGEGRDQDAPQFCDACFTGDYPIGLASGLSRMRVSVGHTG